MHDFDGYYHPASEAELVDLVHMARERGLPLRVRGSAHSIPAAIHTDARLHGHGRAIDVMLDRYGAVRFDDERMQVTVEAGCHLGDDPRDPTALATWNVSLLAQLQRRGWALPDLGGVSHQTVSGFVLTGSRGGTIIHSFEATLVALRCIDGRGQVREYRRGQDSEFDALACSFGLLGVVSTLTLQCVPSYDVIGQEDITGERDCAIDLFEPGASGLAAFLRRSEYARLLWWPQAGVRRVVVWHARRMAEHDYDEHTGARGRLRAKPYLAMPETSTSPALNQLASAAMQWLGGKFYDLVEHARALPVPAAVGTMAAPVFERRVLPAVLGEFVPLDAGKPQRFWDSWCRALPMDNQMSEAALPTSFTELFVPLDQADAVMRTLREHFANGGLAATGIYIFEFYAAAASTAWLHPAYERDSLRIDVFWFERSLGDREAFFQKFWRLLAPFDYRLHWGKHLPRDPAFCAEYLRPRYPRWDEFLAFRREQDPDDSFLTAHWRRALGIER
jgi:hypothetical protein